MDIPPIMEPEKMVEIALKNAIKQSKAKNKTKSLKTLKERESKKVFLFSKALAKRLGKAISSFPEMEKLSPFYRELADLLVNETTTKKALAQLHASKKLLRKKENQFIKEIWRQKNEKAVKKKCNEAIGRLASIVKRTKKSIKALNLARKALREIPVLQLKEKSIILAGFPNTGKTTTLKRLTGSNPKIASYPFTTKKINIGYFNEKHRKIQVIDTPGLLDRKISERNAIEKKAMLALKHLAGLIVFVVDPSNNSGYSLEEQFSLIKEISREFPHIPKIIALNKEDLCGKKEMEKAERIALQKGIKTVRQGKKHCEKALKEEIAREMKLL